MEKKPYHHKNLKNDLIEKGIELVNKNGINQLSLRKVAQACGVSHAAPYSHFSNKEELLQEMQLHITKKFTEVLENTVSQYRGTPIFLLEFGKAYISFFISHPQYFNFLFQQGNIQIDLNIGSGRESNYQPFAIYKEQVLKLLADTNMTQSKKEDLIVALFAYVQGLTTLATMENVHYAYKWEDKLTEFMVGIYLSGTGNTKYCIEKLVSLIHSSAKAIPMESPEAISAIQQNEEIYIGYPTQFSNAPYMVRDFIKKNADIWKNKKILCIATMGAFSGDGAGCTTRMLKRYGATILGGIHIHMPDSVCDSKLLKKTMDENRCIIAQADRKIEEVALQIINGDYPQEGITLVSHIIGLLGQRLWFYKKTKGYSNKLKINNNCIGCGKCVSICPMKNLILRNKKVVSNDRCTMCYRCISLCPQKAITLLGNEVVEQYRIEDYR